MSINRWKIYSVSMYCRNKSNNKENLHEIQISKANPHILLAVLVVHCPPDSLNHVREWKNFNIKTCHRGEYKPQKSFASWVALFFYLLYSIKHKDQEDYNLPKNNFYHLHPVCRTHPPFRFHSPTLQKEEAGPFHAQFL